MSALFAHMAHSLSLLGVSAVFACAHNGALQRGVRGGFFSSPGLNSSPGPSIMAGPPGDDEGSVRELLEDKPSEIRPLNR